jgi:hypothetical protein
LALKSEGASYEDMRDALLNHEDAEIVEWVKEKGLSNDEHELRRIYERAPSDGRQKIVCPARDGELTPVMKILDENLLTDELLPPMRSIEGWPVEVRKCEPIGLHELSSNGANDEENESKRLAPPSSYSIKRHTWVSMAMLIERYINFYVTDDGHDVPKRLPSAYVNAYLEHAGSNLPRVAGISTMPIVLPNGVLLSANGLDQSRKIAFCIDDAITTLMPSGRVKEDAVKEAMRFLLDDWLVDVSTDIRASASDSEGKKYMPVSREVWCEKLDALTRSITDSLKMRRLF